MWNLLYSAAQNIARNSQQNGIFKWKQRFAFFLGGRTTYNYISYLQYKRTGDI